VPIHNQRSFRDWVRVPIRVNNNRNDLNIIRGTPTPEEYHARCDPSLVVHATKTGATVYAY